MLAWAIRICGAGLAFLSFFVIIRYTDLRTASQYSQAWATAAPITLIALGGTYNAIVRILASAAERPIELLICMAIRIAACSAVLTIALAWIVSAVGADVPNPWLCWSAAFLFATAVFLPEYHKARGEFGFSQALIVVLYGSCLFLVAFVHQRQQIALEADIVSSILVIAALLTWTLSGVHASRHRSVDKETKRFDALQFDIRTTTALLMTPFLLGFDVIAVSLSGRYDQETVVAYAGAARIAEGF